MDAARELKPTRRAWGIALFVAGALLLTTAAGVALGQESDSASRSPAPVQAGTTPGVDGGSHEPTGLRSNLGDLPFTGLDLLILGGLAMVLIGTGTALRRLSAPRV